MLEMRVLRYSSVTFLACSLSTLPLDLDGCTDECSVGILPMYLCSAVSVLWRNALASYLLLFMALMISELLKEFRKVRTVFSFFFILGLAGMDLHRCMHF